MENKKEATSLDDICNKHLLFSDYKLTKQERLWLAFIDGIGKGYTLYQLMEHNPVLEIFIYDHWKKCNEIVKEEAERKAYREKNK